MNLIQESVQQFLPAKRKPTSGGWVSFDAVCCHHRGERQDRRGRGGILFTEEGFTYSCFNCGFKAGWSSGKLLSKNTKDLFKWMGMPESDVGKLNLEALRIQDNSKTPAEKTLSFTLLDVALPANCKPIKEWVLEGADDPQLVECVQYILDRGLTLDDYNWYWADENGYRDRVIIPFWQGEQVVGWTGRKIVDGKPKYLTHSQQGYVFNINPQTYDRKFCIVVEGQFDAIAVSGVAIMHNEPSELQCARINRLNKEVVVVPDRDRAGAKMLKAALENGWSVSLPPWGDDIKDVAEAVKRYGKVYVLNSILRYRENNKLKIELLKKKLEKLNGK